MFISFAGGNEYLLFFGFIPVFPANLNKESALPTPSVQQKSVAVSADQKYSLFYLYSANSLKFKTSGTDWTILRMWSRSYFSPEFYT